MIVSLTLHFMWTVAACRGRRKRCLEFFYVLAAVQERTRDGESGTNRRQNSQSEEP